MLTLVDPDATHRPTGSTPLRSAQDDARGSYAYKFMRTLRAQRSSAGCKIINIILVVISLKIGVRGKKAFFLKKVSSPA